MKKKIFLVLEDEDDKALHKKQVRTEKVDQLILIQKENLWFLIDRLNNLDG